MSPHTRAMVAASAFAIVTGKKVAGLYDHSAGRYLKIAADSRGDRLQGFDGERSVKFGGTLPEIYDAGDKAHVSIEADGETVKGHDRGSQNDFSARVSDGAVQLYDYGEGAWFAYDVQDPGGAGNYRV